ncbi:hypothetical protein L1987_61324 [Smallanthus sonchifolius]|uniref:Uncharacterized protein n=1 Tax=Smallanthus sonchifolius TaxID=185202 RepID=A0ACB9DAH5_9ASTR|nr:hypothetical protein L1987_61324 [Smallanthus sonchifolius]
MNPVRWGDCKSRSKPAVSKAQQQRIPNTQLPWNGGGGPFTSDGYDESSRPPGLYSGDRPVKLEELNPAMADCKYSPQWVVRNKDLLEDAGLCRNKLDHCSTPEMLSRFEDSLKVAQRESKKVERFKYKVADKDKEIRHLKKEVENLKKIAKTSKVEHQSEVSVLNMCLQDVQAQLEYKDRLLVGGVTELDLLLLADNRRLEDDRKWLISEGFAHAINEVHQSLEFLQPYADFILLQFSSEFKMGLWLATITLLRVFLSKNWIFTALGLKISSSWHASSWKMLGFHVEKLSSMVDQPLDVIRGLEPEGKHASEDSDTDEFSLVTIVDQYLKQLEPGHVDVGVPS